MPVFFPLVLLSTLILPFGGALVLDRDIQERQACPACYTSTAYLPATDCPEGTTCAWTFCQGVTLPPVTSTVPPVTPGCTTPTVTTTSPCPSCYTCPTPTSTTTACWTSTSTVIDYGADYGCPDVECPLPGDGGDGGSSGGESEEQCVITQTVDGGPPTGCGCSTTPTVTVKSPPPCYGCCQTATTTVYGFSYIH